MVRLYAECLAELKAVFGALLGASGFQEGAQLFVFFVAHVIAISLWPVRLQVEYAWC